MSQHEQIGALIESWTRSQQQIWENWMVTLKKFSAGGAAQPTLHEGLERWQESVNHTLDAQAQAMTAWASQIANVEGAPPETARWAQEGVKLVEQWTAAQRSLWHQWFGMLGKTVESGGTPPGTDQFKQFMSGWEQVGKQMQELQNTWAEGLPGGKKKQ